MIILDVILMAAIATVIVTMLGYAIYSSSPKVSTVSAPSRVRSSRATSRPQVA